jgi:two-component system phosphate regulon response regulator PhoB
MFDLVEESQYASPVEKLLVVDDDEDILELVCFQLNKEGYKVFRSKNGEEGLQLALREKPDLVVLDIMLPGLSGIEVLKRLKHQRQTQGIPVLMLTAKGDELDRVLGFELGAEDYVTKPFSVRELLLRIRAILSRLSPVVETGAVLRCERISLDRDRYEVRVDDKPLELTTTEFKLLAFLLENQGRVVSRDQLLDKVWGYSYGGATRTVDTHVQRLREKLGAEGACLRTIRGVGYKLGPVEE